MFDMDAQEILLTGKQSLRVKVRSLVCYWAVKELGMAGTEEDYEKSYVPDKAKKVLSRHDDRSQHYEIKESIMY